MIARLKVWWGMRRATRTFEKMTPPQQLAVFAGLLDQNPQLRQMFREALRVRSYEELSPKKGRLA